MAGSSYSKELPPKPDDDQWKTFLLTTRSPAANDDEMKCFPQLRGCLRLIEEKEEQNPMLVYMLKEKAMARIQVQSFQLEDFLRALRGTSSTIYCGRNGCSFLTSPFYTTGMRIESEVCVLENDPTSCAICLFEYKGEGTASLLRLLIPGTVVLNQKWIADNFKETWINPSKFKVIEPFTFHFWYSIGYCRLTVRLLPKFSSIPSTYSSSYEHSGRLTAADKPGTSAEVSVIGSKSKVPGKRAHIRHESIAYSSHDSTPVGLLSESPKQPRKLIKVEPYDIKPNTEAINMSKEFKPFESKNTKEINMSKEFKPFESKNTKEINMSKEFKPFESKSTIQFNESTSPPEKIEIEKKMKSIKDEISSIDEELKELNETLKRKRNQKKVLSMDLKTLGKRLDIFKIEMKKCDMQKTSIEIPKKREDLT